MSERSNANTAGSETSHATEMSHSEPDTTMPTIEGLQLRLLPGGVKRPDWQLDERTRVVGRQGVAQAREILRQARPPEPKQPAPVRKAS